MNSVIWILMVIILILMIVMGVILGQLYNTQEMMNQRVNYLEGEVLVLQDMLNKVISLIYPTNVMAREGLQML